MEEQEIIPDFSFKPSGHFNKKNIVKTDLLPDNKCFVLYNVLTKDECAQLINQGEQYGFLSLARIYNPAYRNNKRIINVNNNLKSTLWDRINEYLEETIIVDKHDADITSKNETFHLTPSTDGTWVKTGFNERFRLCKYNPTNFFRNHFDEGYHPHPTKMRTMKTCMVYLNEDFEGGETVFYFDEKNPGSTNSAPTKLKPKIGMCLIFNQKILHAGATVISGLKYFVRNDIYYTRMAEFDKSKNSVTKLTEDELTDIEKEAVEIYKNGVELEESGNISESINCYIKSTKMCENVYELYNTLYST